jgi:hypothetical protein
MKANGHCIDFSVAAGTGCAWMCGYCASQLGTNNYYFTTDVCTYQPGIGCIGSPVAGTTYTCCAVNIDAIPAPSPTFMNTATVSPSPSAKQIYTSSPFLNRNEL